MANSFLALALFVLCFHAVVGIPLTFDFASSNPAKDYHEKLGVPIKWGDINILHITDVHSWLSGHQHEENIQADIGDVVSFYSHLKEMASSIGKDLWFFDRYKLEKDKAIMYINSSLEHTPYIILTGCFIRGVPNGLTLRLSTSIVRYFRCSCTLPPARN
jgi:hypothetical protein